MTQLQNMPIPTYEKAMLPFLKFLKDNKEHSLQETISHITQEFNLTDKEKEQLLSSGKPVIANRVAWARTYLGKAGLVAKTRRGFFKITERGHQVLKDNPPEITDEYLSRFPEFTLFLKPIQQSKSKVKLVPGTLVPALEMPKHNTIRDMLFDIGKFENRIAEVEYPIDNWRLDTVWKTIPTGCVLIPY